MKRLFLLLGILLLSSPVFAKTIPVQAVTSFSTENPSSTMTVVALDDLYLNDNEKLFHSGYVIHGKVVDVKSPKRLKRDAGFTFVPEKFKDEHGIISEITGYYPAKYTTKLNKKEVAKSAALSVGNYFVQGLSMGYHAVEGAVKNEKDNRLKSGVSSVYENSPFSYVEKGEDLYIEKDDVFLLNFNIKKKDVPNYEYEVLD